MQRVKPDVNTKLLTIACWAYMSTQIFIKDVQPHFHLWKSQVNGVLFVESMFLPSLIVLTLMLAAFISREKRLYVVAALAYSILIGAHGIVAFQLDPDVTFLNMCQCLIGLIVAAGAKK